MFVREGARHKESMRPPFKPVDAGLYSVANLKEIPMQRKSFSRISMVAAPMMIAGAILAAGSPALAQSNDIQSNDGRSADRDCSNRTLRGDYGFAVTGVLLNTPGLPPEAQFRSVGLAHYDGRGHVRMLEHTVLNGIPLDTSWTASSGTYSVNPDCTGTSVVNTPNSPVPLNLFFVVVNDGREIHTVLNANALSTVSIKIEAHEHDRDEAGGGDR
jgi:hypothetical protein